MEDKRNRGRRITDRITEAYYELMKIVAEKYGGNLYIEAKGGVFRLSVMMTGR